MDPNLSLNKALHSASGPVKKKNTDVPDVSPCVVVIGGTDPAGGGKSSGTDMMTFDPDAGEWVLMDSLPEPRYYHASVIMHGDIYVIGGMDPGSSKVMNTNFSYCVREQTWCTRAPMCLCRAYHCAAVVVGKLVVCGGVDDEFNILATTEMYQPECDQWIGLSSLPYPVMGAGCASYDGSLFLIGGVTNSRNRIVIVDYVFGFDPIRNIWRNKTALPIAIAFPSIGFIDSSLWVLGGYNTTSLDLCMEYRNDTKCWAFRHKLDPPRHAAAAAYHRNACYLIGGMNGETVSPLSDVTIVTNEMAQPGIEFPSAITGATAITMTACFKDKVPCTKNLGDCQKWANCLDPRVCIPGWPPYIGFGCNTMDSGDIPMRYINLTITQDPNLGILPCIDTDALNNRISLGLRRVDIIPKRVRDLSTALIVREEFEPSIIFFGGLDLKDPLNNNIGTYVLKYLPLRNKWQYVNQMPEPRNHHAACIGDTHIFISGGYDVNVSKWGEFLSTKTTFAFCIATGMWEYKCDMLDARAHHVLLAYKGTIYAIGGRNDCGCILASCETCTEEDDNWSYSTEMECPLMGMGAAIFQNKIMVVGGIHMDECGPEAVPAISDKVLCFDPEGQQWTKFLCLRCPRAFCSAVVVAGQLWVVGGCLGSRDLISIAAIDSFNEKENCWDRRATMLWPRHCACIVPVETCIYAIGGITSQQWKNLSKVEMFMVEEGRQHLCQELPLEITGSAAISIAPCKRIMDSPSFCRNISRQLKK